MFQFVFNLIYVLIYVLLLCVVFVKLKMSTSNVLVPCDKKVESKNLKKDTVTGKDSSCPDEALPTHQSKKELIEALPTHQSKKELIDAEEKPATGKKSIACIYDKEILLELRSASSSLKKPDCLNEVFFNKDGVWDPEAWHKSNTSRSASPAVDGKTVVVEGKKIELMDDDIELAPHRRSFRQGCQVQSHDADKPEKSGTRALFDRKNRLTGRAASQRRTIETNLRDHNETIIERTNEFEKARREREKYYDKENRFPDKDSERYFERDWYADRNNRYPERKDFRRERYDSYYNEKGIRDKQNTYKSSKKRHDGGNEEKLPEWITDGPTSQLDTMEFTGFQDIEEEKKAYAKKKKKVRISPDVEKQATRGISKVNASDEFLKTDGLKEKKEGNPKRKTSAGKTTPDKMFDINEFFNEVDYYPPHMFPEDIVNGDGVKSRFTQWFQSKASRSSSQNSVEPRPGSATLLPEEVFTGGRAKSPATQAPYFTPIQPAPSLVTAAANAHVMQTSNILNIMYQQKQLQMDDASTAANKEVKGRLNVEDLEVENSTKPNVDVSERVTEDFANEKNAFDLLVKSMKEAGQLPEKPAPVVSDSSVTGLPDHLLPQPPKRTSPAFEKLKRTLSRSPSPVELMKAVSTVASIITSNPGLEAELAILQQKRTTQKNQPLTPMNMPPSKFFNQQSEKVPHNRVGNHGDVTTPHSQSLSTLVDGTTGVDRTNSPSLDESSQTQKRLPTAFMPTSVLKKMHNEKRDSPVPTSEQQPHPDVSLVNVHNSTYPDLLPENVREANKVHSPGHLITPERLNFEKSIVENEPLLLFHSAPATPRNQLNLTVGAPPHSVSAPGTPDHRFVTDPPLVQRVSSQSTGISSNNLSPHGLSLDSAKGKDSLLLAPSAFQSTTRRHSNKSSSIGVIGSGIHQRSQQEIDFRNPLQSLLDQHRSNASDLSNHIFADPRLAPGNGAVRSNRSLKNPLGSVNPKLAPGHPLKPQMQSTPMPPQEQMHQSQQQQLLHAQRMALIQKAQIHQQQIQQQQKLQQIANQANQQQVMQHKQTGQQTKLFPTPVGVRPLLPDPENSNHQQPRPLYQQQQHQQIQAFQQQQQQKQQLLAQQQQHNPRAPGQFMNNFRGRPFQPPQTARNSPPMPVPMQQLQNLARPQGMNVNLAAQALVQQQLLTQAARARFIAQAQLLQQQPQVMQAAIMAQAALARGQAQMMMNQRNIQAMAEQMGIRPPLNVNSKAIPTPMLSPQQAQNSIPLGTSASTTAGNIGTTSESVLSKWFGKDILQQIPNNTRATEIPTGKVLSVEELERAQCSS